MNDNTYFYRDLPVVEQFSDMVNMENYEALPDDWLVIATDIRGSTRAISEGKYKTVNLAGACAIAAILNDFPKLEIPFVFDGDGVTIAMPDMGRDRVLGLLSFCRNAVKASFGLELAAGCKTMGELRQDGKEIKVCKVRLSEHVAQAIPGEATSGGQGGIWNAFITSCNDHLFCDRLSAGTYTFY